MMGPDEKYITFKRDEFMEVMTPQARNMVTSQMHLEEVVAVAIPDAVVIRRQDKFASPCLATYAAMIGMVAMEHPDKKTQTELLAIADYFEEQAKLAAEEGHKLPDL